MFSPGDVIGFYVRSLEKEKYHLCLSLNGYYVFVSTKREVTYEGDLVVPCSEFPFLTPTQSGYSRISCVRVIQISDNELERKTSLRKIGTVSGKLLKQILAFIEGNPAIPEETQEAILDGLGEWL